MIGRGWIGVAAATVVVATGAYGLGRLTSPGGSNRQISEAQGSQLAASSQATGASPTTTIPIPAAVPSPSSAGSQQQATSTTTTTTAPTPAASSATREVLVSPFGPSGPANGDSVTIISRATGDCWIGSEGESSRADAYRCSTNNTILDPCFSDPFGDAGYLLCPNSPTDLKSVALRPTSPLPANSPNPGAGPCVRGAAVTKLAALGVRRGRDLDVTTETGKRLIGIGSSGAFTTWPGSVNASVERLVESNAAKLLRAEANERHLFVWVRSTAGGAELSLYLNHVPDEPPALPVGIDSVWVARTGTGGDSLTRLWRSTPPGGWEILCTAEGT